MAELSEQKVFWRRKENGMRYAIVDVRTTFAILVEIDSGLDIDALKVVAKGK